MPRTPAHVATLQALGFDVVRVFPHTPTGHDFMVTTAPRGERPTAFDVGAAPLPRDARLVSMGHFNDGPVADMAARAARGGTAYDVTDAPMVTHATGTHDGKEWVLFTVRGRTHIVLRGVRADDRKPARAALLRTVRKALAARV